MSALRNAYRWLRYGPHARCAECQHAWIADEVQRRRSRQQPTLADFGRIAAAVYPAYITWKWNVSPGKKRLWRLVREMTL
jgi:hypothetical protein